MAPLSLPDLTLLLPDETATAQLGRHLATKLRPGDSLLLQGPIGAGKSHLARAFIRQLLGEVDVPSPSFTLVQTYEGPDCEIWHADLYRLTHPDEVLELGLEQAFDTAICLIEWPELIESLLPEKVVRVKIEVEPDGSRKFTAAIE